MAKLNVIDRDGKKHVLDTVDGWRVMEIIREHGLDIEGICDGAMECSTCHVLVAKEWLDKLHPMKEEEEDLLYELPTFQDNSRLCCQIIWEEKFDGLEVTLAEKE